MREKDKCPFNLKTKKPSADVQTRTMFSFFFLNSRGSVVRAVQQQVCRRRTKIRKQGRKNRKEDYSLSGDRRDESTAACLQNSQTTIVTLLITQL